MTATTATPAQALELLYIDPSALLVDKNIREAQLTKEFIDDIKALGVTNPPLVMRTRDNPDTLRVLVGHRRTLAAREAQLAAIPVLIAGTEGDDDASNIQRLTIQYSENEQRENFTTAERASAINQMAAFGVSAAKIATKLGVSKTDVEAAKAVVGSETATAKATAYELTMTEAATLAEFEDDEEAINRLIDNRGSTRFDHAANDLRDDRERKAKIAAIAAPLAAEGVTILDRKPYTWDRSAPQRELSDIRTKQGEPLTEETHHTCPGHAAYIAVYAKGEAEISFYCLDYKANGHKNKPAGTSPKVTDEQAKTNMTETKTNHPKMAATQEIRRAWLRDTIAKRSSAPIGAANFLAHCLAEPGYQSSFDQSSTKSVALELLGTDAKKLETMITNAKPARATVIALVFVLARYEASITKETWRNADSTTARYLRQIEAWGYGLADVEQLAAKQYRQK